MDKQRISPYIAALLLHLIALSIQAEDLNPDTLLKKHYLSKYTEKKQDSHIYIKPLEETDELKRYALDERMTPLKVRATLLHYLCLECSNKKKSPNVMPVNYHTDVWHDTQVFMVPGKAHIYDAAFPGTTTMGEVYGAYMLVAGATHNHFLLTQRQGLIRQIQERGLADQLREQLKKLNHFLPPGLAIFDKVHPFNKLSKTNIFMEERGFGSLASNSDISSYMNNYFGFDSSTYFDRMKRSSFQNNLIGQSTIQMALMPYVTSALSIPMNIINSRFSKNARSLKNIPWQGPGSYISNVMRSTISLGGYSHYLLALEQFATDVFTIPRIHNSMKNTKEVLIDELMALKPFLEVLFSFKKVQGLPLINFTMTRDEEIITDAVLRKINNLKVDRSHNFLSSFAAAASTLRWVLLQRELIVRYLVNISRLDFYISVAEKTKEPGLWSFVKWYSHEGQIQPKPKIMAKKLWNPGLPPEKAVPSDVKLGGSDPANIILTGANASGKSTLLRGLGINTIFMAQTLGVAASESFKLRPYSHFDSLMEKRDKHGRSSYETEVDAVVRVWGVNSKLNKAHRSLILADELFRTTNPTEGDSASELLVRKIGNLPHVSLLVSTHFNTMKQLAVKQPKQFANKHMSVDTDNETGQITQMHYRLVDGPSPSINAIQLFEQEFSTKFPELYQH